MPLKEGTFDLRRFKVGGQSRLNGVTIREAGFNQYDCIVVGLERQGTRTPSPKSDLALAEGDVVWVVGQGSELTRLREVFH
jgi:CPA2 family monovalent cation:H+ antiporter-2